MLIALAALSSSASHPDRCTAQATRPFTAKVWSLDKWSRGQPKPSTLTAYRKRLSCAGPENRKAIKNYWAFEKQRYYEHRKKMLWLEKYKPFVYPSGKRWAVPYPIAVCESNENYYVGPSGAYGLIPPFPQYMSPRAQDETAHRLYLEQGEGPWAPYEAGCAYR